MLHELFIILLRYVTRLIVITYDKRLVITKARALCYCFGGRRRGVVCDYRNGRALLTHYCCLTDVNCRRSAAAMVQRLQCQGVPFIHIISLFFAFILIELELECRVYQCLHLTLQLTLHRIKYNIYDRILN